MRGVPQDLPAHLDARLEQRDARRAAASGCGTGRSATGPLISSLPFIDTPASAPGTCAAAMPVSDRRASVDVPGPAKTCPPQFSQYRPRRSDRMRPPTRLPDSRSTVSQCRSRQAGGQAGEAASDDDDVLHAESLQRNSTQSERCGRGVGREEAETEWPTASDTVIAGWHLADIPEQCRRRRRECQRVGAASAGAGQSGTGLQMSPTVRPVGNGSSGATTCRT